MGCDDCIGWNFLNKLWFSRIKYNNIIILWTEGILFGVFNQKRKIYGFCTNSVLWNINTKRQNNNKWQNYFGMTNRDGLTTILIK